MRICCIVSNNNFDVMLPKMNGIDILKEIRKMTAL